MVEDKNKEKSLTRSKKSIVSLIDIVGKEVLTSLAPGSGLAYEISKTLLKHAKNFYDDLINSRIQQFHKTLIEGTTEDELRELLGKTFSLEDYYIFLSNAIRDDEEAKVTIYSKLFKAIINKAIPQEYKLNFIRSAKELTCCDIELMRQIYVKFKPKSEFTSQAENFLEPEINDPVKNFSMQTLIRLGFLIEKERGLKDITWGDLGKKRLEPSKLLEVFCGLIFAHRELMSL